MSEENVETVRRFFELVNQQALDDLAAFAPADFELDLSRSRGLNTGVYRAEQAVQTLKDLTEAFADYEFFETEIIDAGDTVVRVGGMRGRGKGSGRRGGGRRCECVELPRWFARLLRTLPKPRRGPRSRRAAGVGGATF